MTPDKEGDEKLRAARLRLVYLRPYFARAAFTLVFVQSEIVPTLGVDKYKRLYWNPRFVREHSVDQLTSVLVHEIGHVLHDHHRRAHEMGVTYATAEIANVAQDAALNDDLRDEIAEQKDLAELPGNHILPELIDCEDYKHWEEYYMHLLSTATVILLTGKDGDSPGGGGNQKGAKGAKGVGSTGKGRGEGQERQQGQRVVHVDNDCGSGAHGIERPWELGGERESDVEVISDADWKEIQRLTAEAIIETQKMRGSVPGNWVAWADTIIRPRHIPWDQILGGMVRFAVSDVAGVASWNFSRPSRRQSITRDFVLPAMRRPVPNVVIVGDTSGSMSDRDLAIVAGTAEDVARSMGAQVAFLATDADVHGGVQRMTSARGLKLAGRGGTDMCVGIEYAIRCVRPSPDSIVVCTDCATPWPGQAPRARIIICAITEELPSDLPSWAKVVHIRPSELRGETP